MYIGEVAKKTGLPVKAIRFYEEKGLLKKPERKGRYRVYQQAEIELLILIKEAKALGVTLSQIKDAIAYKNGKIDWENIKTFLADLREQLVLRIADLEKKIETLDSCYDQITP